MADIKCMRCPLCGRIPVVILGFCGQAFCGNDDCNILMWDVHATKDENLEGLADELIELASRMEPGGPPAPTT
jgi:hypothetical protein